MNTVYYPYKRFAKISLETLRRALGTASLAKPRAKDSLASAGKAGWLFYAALPFALLGVGGCAHTPSEPKSPENVQTAWESEAEVPLDAAPASASSSVSAAADAAADAQALKTLAWWTTFNDPTLDALITLAERNNLDLKVAAERVLEAEALRRGAFANLLPEFGGVATAGRSRRSGSGTRNQFSVGVEATWEVDVSGRLSALERASSANFVATQADAATVRQLLLATVASAYVEYRLQNLQLELTAETLRLQEQTHTITEHRYAAGMANELEVQRSLSTLAQTRSDAAVATEAAAAARYLLSYLLALNPEQLQALIPPQPQDAPAADALPRADALAVLLSPLEVLENRPDVAAAAARYSASAASYDAAEAARLPRLTLGGLIGLENERLSDIFDGEQLMWSAAGNLAAPLLDFGRRRSEAQAADSRRRQAELNYERTVRMALSETQTAVVSYVQGVVRNAELTIAVDAAQKAAQIAQAQYEEGVISQFETLESEKTLRQVRQQWARSGADVALRLIELYRVMGIAPEAADENQH